MAQLVSIGTSRGVRIPKVLIKQAQLENVELSFKVLETGLLIMPHKKARTNWQQQCEEIIIQHGHESLDKDWLDADLTGDCYD